MASWFVVITFNDDPTKFNFPKIPSLKPFCFLESRCNLGQQWRRPPGTPARQLENPSHLYSTRLYNSVIHCNVCLYWFTGRLSMQISFTLELGTFRYKQIHCLCLFVCIKTSGFTVQSSSQLTALCVYEKKHFWRNWEGGEERDAQVLMRVSQTGNNVVPEQL